MHMRALALLLWPVLLLATACADHLVITPVEESTALSRGNAPDIVPGRFIITVRPGVSPTAVAQSYGVTPQFTYRHALNGFAGAISEAARQGLLRDARVLRIEPDGIVRFAETTQTNAPWALDRIDQRELPLNETYTYSMSGRGVTAYVIDSGIRFSHTEFGGRATLGYDFALDTEPESNLDPTQGPGEDCNGHGTFVAGTLGGATYGAAKNVNLVSVRLSGCAGGFPMSRVIAAVDWVTANAVRPAVANLSLAYSGSSSALDDAVRNMIASGIATTVAAGNGNMKDGACHLSPARVREAMTIGSSDLVDDRSSFSNYGNCVDWYAPGSGVGSASWTGDTEARVGSGTSASAPLTAGVAALFLEANPGATPAQVFSALRDATTKQAIQVGEERHPRNGKITGNTFGDLLHSRFASAGEGGGGGGGDEGGEKPCRGNKCK